MPAFNVFYRELVNSETGEYGEIQCTVINAVNPDVARNKLRRFVRLPYHITKVKLKKDKVNG